MTFAPVTIAPMKYLHAKPHINPPENKNSYPVPNPDIKPNLKPEYNPNPYPKPKSFEKLRQKQLSREQMLCHHTQ